MASTPNAHQFWTNTFCDFVARGWDVFWFEAFDEPSKSNESGKDAGHWGAMTIDRGAKFALVCHQ